MAPMPSPAKVQPEKRCNCLKSQCLKLYCECFAAGRYCSRCACQDCRNNEENAQLVTKRRNDIRDKNPEAFGGACKGCNCKRSQCLKMYCECFKHGVACADHCKCNDCHNLTDGLRYTSKNRKGSASSRSASQRSDRSVLDVKVAASHSQRTSTTSAPVASGAPAHAPLARAHPSTDLDSARESPARPLSAVKVEDGLPNLGAQTIGEVPASIKAEPPHALTDSAHAAPPPTIEARTYRPTDVPCLPRQGPVLRERKAVVEYSQMCDTYDASDKEDDAPQAKPSASCGAGALESGPTRQAEVFHTVAPEHPVEAHPVIVRRRCMHRTMQSPEVPRRWGHSKPRSQVQTRGNSLSGGSRQPQSRSAAAGPPRRMQTRRRATADMDGAADFGSESAMSVDVDSKPGASLRSLALSPLQATGAQILTFGHVGQSLVRAEVEDGEMKETMSLPLATKRRSVDTDGSTKWARCGSGSRSFGTNTATTPECRGSGDQPASPSYTSLACGGMKSLSLKRMSDGALQSSRLRLSPPRERARSTLCQVSSAVDRDLLGRQDTRARPCASGLSAQDGHDHRAINRHSLTDRLLSTLADRTVCGLSPGRVAPGSESLAHARDAVQKGLMTFSGVTHDTIMAPTPAIPNTHDSPAKHLIFSSRDHPLTSREHDSDLSVPPNTDLLSASELRPLDPSIDAHTLDASLPYHSTVKLGVVLEGVTLKSSRNGSMTDLEDSPVNRSAIPQLYTPEQVELLDLNHSFATHGRLSPMNGIDLMSPRASLTPHMLSTCPLSLHALSRPTSNMGRSESEPPTLRLSGLPRSHRALKFSDTAGSPLGARMPQQLSSSGSLGHAFPPDACAPRSVLDYMMQPAKQPDDIRMQALEYMNNCTLSSEQVMELG